jgi:rhodanese-related sulfurtransferase
MLYPTSFRSSSGSIVRGGDTGYGFAFCGLQVELFFTKSVGSVMSERQSMSLMDFVKAAKANIREVSPSELVSMYTDVEDLLVLDVREAGEHEQGHLKGAMLVPRGILEAAADPAYPKHQPELSSARNRPIAVYCATGGRSAMAAMTLQLMGFENVVNLDGGITRWIKENHPVVREARYV